MNIEIRNFGKIKEANIVCSGLTLLTGNNDSGKSTVGKLLFSVIETLSVYKSYSEKKSDALISKQLGNFLYSTKMLDYISSHVKKSDKDQFSKISALFQEILENFDKYKDKIHTFLNNEKEYREIINHVDDYNKIRKLFDNSISKFYITLQDVLLSEFKKQFNKENSLIKINNGKNLITIDFNNEGTLSDKEFDLDYLTNKFFNKVFFIETPWILEHYKIFKETTTYMDYATEIPTIGKKREENYNFTSLHTKEMAINIENCLKKNELVDNEIEMQKIINNISETVKGSFVYSKESELLKFVRNDKSFDVSNIASGIKSFGLMDTILKAGVLDNRSLLILDEPEAHLHPVWQVKYAEIVVQLVLHGINVVVASHSEIFVDALRQSCVKYDIWNTEKVNAYYAIDATQTGVSTTIQNVKNIDEKENIIYKSFYESNKMIDNINM